MTPDPILEAGPDPVAYAAAELEALLPGSAAEGVPVVCDRVRDQQPPFYLVQDRLATRSVGAYLPARVRVSAWGRSAEEAAAMYRAASALLHRHGPATNAHGRAWRLKEEVGGQPTQDPDTHWPLTSGVFDVYMADR